MRKTLKLGVILVGLLITIVACDKPRTYHSIWSDVYYSTPPYQEELEELEVD